jgi:hypothetical protein
MCVQHQAVVVRAHLERLLEAGVRLDEVPNPSTLNPAIRTLDPEP